MANQYAAVSPDQQKALLANSGTGNTDLETRRLVAEDGKLWVEEKGTVKISGAYGVNDIEPAAGTITYLGKESISGDWLVQKIDASGTPITFQYASELNNGSITTYSDAWDNRAALTYADYSSVL